MKYHNYFTIFILGAASQGARRSKRKAGAPPEDLVLPVRRRSVSLPAEKPENQ